MACCLTAPSHYMNQRWLIIKALFCDINLRATSQKWSSSHCGNMVLHYSDVIMGMMASQITSLTIVYSTVYSDADQRKHQSSASLAFVRGIHRGPVNSPHKWPVTWKMFPFDDVIMVCVCGIQSFMLGTRPHASGWSSSHCSNIAPDPCISTANDAFPMVDLLWQDIKKIPDIMPDLCLAFAYFPNGSQNLTAQK